MKINLIDYFDKVDIINIQSRSDRKIETEDEFKRHGFTIDGKKASFFKAVTVENAAGFPSKGARGCFLSHLNILKSAIDAGQESQLIIEDDICFIKDISAIQVKIIEQLNEMDWDIVYLGHTLASKNEHRFIKVTTKMQESHCYAVNRKCLTRLFNYLECILTREPGHSDGGPMHYDGALNMFIARNPDLKVYYYAKNLAYQRPSATDIHEGAKLEKVVVIKPIIRLYRKLKNLAQQRLR